MKTTDSKKTVIARPVSLIARKASGRMVVQTGLRAGAATTEQAEKRR